MDGVGGHINKGKFPFPVAEEQQQFEQQDGNYSLRSERSVSGSSSMNSVPGSPIASHNPYGPSAPFPRRGDSLKGSSSSHQGSSRIQQYNPNDVYRNNQDAAYNLQNPRQRPQETSRFRNPNNDFNFQNADSRPLREATQAENFSRPRRSSVKSSDEPPKQVLHSSSTFPLQPHVELALRNVQASPDDRGPSTSSSKQSGTYTSPPLRSFTSIPDWTTADTIQPRHRNFTNPTSYRPGTAFDGYSHRRDPPLRPAAVDGEESRTSFRSALTNTSSYLGTSGTERSSVLTKSSAATSVYTRDEGMSVDDAIGMYEAGFGDSGPEDDDPSRPESTQSQKSLEGPSTHTRDELPLPPNLSNTIIRDSAAIFQNPGAIQSSNQLPASSILPREIQPPPPPAHTNSDDFFPGPGRQLQSTDFDSSRDRYGFKKASQYITLAQYEAWNGPYTAYLARRRRKWIMLLKDAGLPTDQPVRFPPRSAKVKRFIRKGIPPDWRGAAWFYYAGGPAMVARHPGLYNDLVQRALAGRMSPTDEELIERDLNRTFPDNIKFRPDPVSNAESESGNNVGKAAGKEPETPMLQALRRVLQAFSIYNPRIGYCQSLNFLAGLLLLFMGEEESFWLLNIITRLYLPGTHEVNLEGANVDLGVLMTSIRESMPAIWAKIGGELDGSAATGASNPQSSMRLPPITLCCTAWFMSCFIGTLPIETTLRVWDSFFYEGSKTLFRIAMAIFKVGEAEIRAVNDPMEIFQVVQTIPRKLIDASALMEACFKRRNGFGHLSQDTIESRRAERRAGYAEERAVAAGVIAPRGTETVGRKNTLFKRRRGRTTVEAPI